MTSNLQKDPLKSKISFLRELEIMGFCGTVAFMASGGQRPIAALQDGSSTEVPGE